MMPILPPLALRRQITRRLALALLAAFVVVGMVGFALYQAALRQSAEHQIDTASAFYQGRLAELDGAWESEAIRLKSRLEFTRLMEDQARREAAVRSYFTMQGEELIFSHVLILDANGKPLLSLGNEAVGLYALLLRDTHATKFWLYEAEQKHLYRVYQQPIWLGQEGSGRLLLLLQVDHGLLYSSAAHNTQLFALWEQAPVASSLGMKGLDDGHIQSGDSGWSLGGAWVEQRRLKWGTEARSPILLVRQQVDSPFSTHGLWIAGIAIMAGIIAVVWWTLGIWMSHMTRRIDSLGAAARGFTQTHELTSQLKEQISIAAGVVKDEIHDVASALMNLAEVVEAREEMLEVQVMARTTELEEAKSRSDELNRMLHAVLDTIPVRIFWKDRNGAYLGCNQLFAQDAGKTSPREVVGETDYDLPWRKEAELYRADDALVMETGRPKLNFEEPQTLRDGSRTWLRTSKVPLRDAAGEVIGVLGTYEDITEEKQVALALVAARDAAESASRAKSEFLASMSHELRTPLNGVLGFAQLLGMDAELSEEVKENVQEIERAGQHLLSLVNDLIDLARIEAGKLELSLEPVPIKSVVAESLALVVPIASKQSIELIDENSECPEAAVRADYIRLRQVLINLLSNAIKYNRPHGTVRLSCRMTEGSVRIDIADTGPGIPVDKQSRIFNAFDRLGAECGTVEGTGIGLVITKRIVEAMGGTIGFDSIEGEGSTFWVAFPLAEPAGHPEPEGAATEGAQEMDSPLASCPVVPYVEDNPLDQEIKPNDGTLQGAPK